MPIPFTNSQVPCPSIFPSFHSPSFLGLGFRVYDSDAPLQLLMPTISVSAILLSGLVIHITTVFGPNLPTVCRPNHKGPRVVEIIRIPSHLGFGLTFARSPIRTRHCHLVFPWTTHPRTRPHHPMISSPCHAAPPSQTPPANHDGGFRILGLEIGDSS